jgi:hypothetical protein
MPLTVNSRYAGLPVFDALDTKGVSHPTVAIRPPVQLAAGTAVYEHLVTGVETIEYLAWRYYGDSRMWWKIADANDLMFPLDVATGTTLNIPGARDVGTIVRTRSFG